jgi:dTMP kinase
MRDPGRFIVLEGGEGAGKSTQAALLSGWLAEAGIDHRLAREPGGTMVGEAIRSVVLGRHDLEMPPESELFLILAARAAFVRDVVRPALADGYVVVADRFSLSTLAYQGYGRGLDLDEIRGAVRMATGGLQPDLYVVLDVPVEEGSMRQRRSGLPPDRIEQEGEDFLVRVREAYLRLAECEARVVVVNGQGPPEEVHGRIRTLLQEAFPATFAPGVV